MWQAIVDGAMPDFWPPRPSRFWSTLFKPFRRWYLHSYYGIAEVVIEGLERLKERLAEHFASRWEVVRLLLPYADGAALSELYALGAPIEHREDTPDGVLVVARLPRRDLRRYARFLVADAHRESA